MTVRAFAKVNLTLEVFGKRADGFHALRSVVLPIGLADTLTFTPADEFSTDTGYPDDLILKVPAALSESVRNEGLEIGNGGRFPVFSIRVEKKIPAGGGLGGGSADAAATLLALNELWRLGKTPEELAAIGAQVGSDVPALVLANHYRAPVLMQGRGEIVSLIAHQSSRVTHRFHLVLANPGVPCSTAAVYGRCRARETADAAILRRACEAWASQDVGRLAGAMVNDLQESAVALCPAIGGALRALRDAGVGGVMMSGSGSTVFGFVSTEEDGRKIAARLNERGLRAWSVVVPPRVELGPWVSKTRVQPLHHGTIEDS